MNTPDPTGPCADDPLAPTWEDFIAARERFFATLARDAEPAKDDDTEAPAAAVRVVARV
ncbi:MAG TPA: hypothetical protein PKD59_10845 [Miltoncostaeaceae bacterium]|nr:hypothetical protein [Miltoncostaeaceae bacterium]